MQASLLPPWSGLFHDVHAHLLSVAACRTLLTDKGARERLREKNITVRQSLAALTLGLHGDPRASQMPNSNVASKGPSQAPNRGGQDMAMLRRSMQSVLQQQFSTTALMRLSTNGNPFKLGLAAAKAQAGGSILDSLGSAPSGAGTARSGVTAAPGVSTISEESNASAG